LEPWRHLTLTLLSSHHASAHHTLKLGEGLPDDLRGDLLQRRRQILQPQCLHDLLDRVLLRALLPSWGCHGACSRIVGSGGCRGSRRS
jgi:hypothetical protein